MGPVGWGGVLSFFLLHRLGPSIYYLWKQNIRDIRQTPQKYLKFQQPTKISPFCPLTLRKVPICIEITPKNTPVLWLPPPPPKKKKCPNNLYTQFYFHFSENPQKYWNSKILTPPPKKKKKKKNGPVEYVREKNIYMFILEYPSGGSGPGEGGTLIFSSCVDSGPVSTVHPKRYQDFKHPPKYLNF